MNFVLVMIQNGAAKVFGAYGSSGEMFEAAEQSFGRELTERLRLSSEGRQVMHSTGAYVVNWQILDKG